MKIGGAVRWVLSAAILLGCTERGPATSVEAAAPTLPPGSAAAPVADGPTLPPPTRSEQPGSGGMRYFHWEPAVSVAELGADPRARAEAVLASPTIREVLGAVAGDGFVFEKSDEAKHMVTFRQTRAFRGQAVIVDGAYATVELAGDTGLVYLGTGFQAGVTLTDADLAVDEAQAGRLAVAAYEAAEKFKGKVTPHRDPGLRVQGSRLVYAIHVQRAEGEGHPRPFMFVVDAQRGEVVDRRQSWIE